MLGRHAWALAALGLALAGCGDGTLGYDGSLGELGEGFFSYNCVDDGDAVCNTSNAVDTMAVDLELGMAGELPAAVAVGARFDLSYWGDISTDDGERLFVETVPASPDDVRQGGGFVIDAPGIYAFLARSPRGVTADFVHLHARPLATLDLWLDEQKVSAANIDADGDVVLAVVPNDDSGLPLAGALGYVWSTSDASVVRVGEIDTVGAPPEGVEHNDDEVRVVGIGAGSAVVTVTMGAVSRSLDVTVVAEVTP
jgi:hypothetical protein